jgi:hypothetical protein
MFGRTGPPSSRPSSSTLPPSSGALLPCISPTQTLADLAYLTPSYSVFAAVWMYTLSHWGDPDYQLTQVRVLTLTCSSSSSSSVNSQNFLEALANPLLPLCRRPLGCHLPGLPRLARQWWLLAILAVPITGSVIGAFLTGQGAITVTLETRSTLTFYVTLWLSFKAGADVLIAAACIWQLRRVKAVFGDTQR